MAAGNVCTTGGFIRFGHGTTLSAAARQSISAGVAVNPPSISTGPNPVIPGTVPGAAVGDAGVVNPGGNLTGFCAYSFARVMAGDTVWIGLIKPGAVAVDPGSATRQFRIIR